MKAYQRHIREKREQEGLDADLFGNWWEDIDTSLSNAVVKRINFNTARPIIEDHEWIGTMPLPKSCRFMYGVYFSGNLGGAVVFVEPSTRQFNETHPRAVVQLNRGACVHWTPKNTASFLIARAKKDMAGLGVKAIIAYCTIEAGEFGTIYQSLNFHYVGQTAPSKTYWLDEHWVAERTLADKKKWAKATNRQDWIDKFQNLPVRSLQGKYRYVLPIGGKIENKRFMRHYGYIPEPYPVRVDKETPATYLTAYSDEDKK